jgi:hypothetical protein
MGSIAIKTEADRQRAIKILQSVEMPCTMTTTKGESRSLKQNRLQQMWNLELSQQGDMTAEDYRAYNKAFFGIPILLAENEPFREQYNAIVRPLAYEKKLEIMKAPIDFPVTRLFTMRQHKQFLDDIYTHWTGKGFHLTDPDWQGMEVSNGKAV